MMTLNPLTSTSPKRRRIMIITADEDIIDQIEKNNDTSLLTQMVIESQTEKSINHDQQMNVQLSEQKNKMNHGSLTCVVCGSAATGHNFGAISCESCKAFFRRNAVKHPSIFQCRNNHNCEINFDTRRDCPACRLAKCYKSGMQRQRVSTQEQKAEKRRRIEENRSLTLHSNSTINEEESPISSSVVFDDFLLSIDTDILLLTDLLQTQEEKVSLSPDDLQRLKHISLSYEKRIELATHDGLPWDPSMPRNTISQILNSQSIPIMRLLSFFKQIPEFNQLNIDDKVTLIKSNLSIVLRMSSTLLYDMKTGHIIERDSNVPYNNQAFQFIHGYNIRQKSKKAFDSFVNIANYDKIIIQLSLIILILTRSLLINDTHESILNDPMSVYRAQNSYIDLLWKYIEVNYGTQITVTLLNQIILGVLSWQAIQEDMTNNVVRVLSPNDIDQLLPIMKSVLHL